MQLLFNIILRALIWIRSICLLCSEVRDVCHAGHGYSSSGRTAEV